MTGGHADVVVVAAGASQRFGTDKLDANVGGRPLLGWTIDRIAASPRVDRIVVVTAADRLARLAAAPWLSPKVAAVVLGGARRQDSVAAGIDAAAGLAPAPDQTGERVVLVHDGARPLVSEALIAAIIDAAREHGAAVPMVPIVETVKRVGADGQVLETVDRTWLATVQTPQGATLETLVRAFESMAGDPREFTDEAALLEACTIPVHAIPGDPANVKVTQPSDLGRVEAFLTSGLSAAGPAAVARVGLGSDSHPFGPADGLALGGIRIDGAPRLHGHSDGDVLLHAIADALLGAAGLGDLGRIFPAGPETRPGIDSAELLEVVRGRVADAGFAIGSVDCTIVAGRPRLASHLAAMGGRIATILGVDPAAVNVKASSGNLDGAEGAGRAISASAVATLAAAGARP